MGTHIYAAVNGLFRNLVALRVCYLRIQAVSRKFTEGVAFIGQRHTFAAGCGYASCNQCAVAILQDPAFGRNQVDFAASGKGSVLQVQGSRRHAVIQNYILHRLQHHVSAGLYLARDLRLDYITVFILFFRAGHPCLQVALAGSGKYIRHFNPAQLHNRIVALGSVNAFHIAVFPCQADDSAIIQNADRIIFFAKPAFHPVGFQFQLFFRIQICQLVIPIGRHSKAFGRFQINGIFSKYRTQPQPVV